MFSRISSFIYLAAIGLLLLIPFAFGQTMSKEEIKRQWNQATDLQKQGKHAEAAAVYEKISTPAEAVYGKEGANTATILHSLGDLYRVMSQYAKAEPLLRRALSMREKNLSKDSLRVAISLDGLGLLYRAMAQYEKAEPLLQRSLRIREAKYAKDHPDVAVSLDNLANLYRAMGQNAKAESLLLRCLRIDEGKLGKDHPNLVIPLTNLADLYQAMAQYEKAEALLQRSLDIGEAKFGRGHANVASSLNSLANLYSAVGLYAKAEPLYLRSLRIDEARHGRDHPDVATALNNLAILYRKMGRYAKVEPLYLRSLRIREARLGKDHPDVAQSLGNLANWYRAIGQDAKVEAFYLRSLKIYETKLGKDNPKVALMLNNLADLYRARGQYAKAEPLLRRSLSIRETKLGKDHPEVAQSLSNQALLYVDMGQYAKAEPLLRRSLSIRETKLGKNHPDVALPLTSLAFLYDRLGQAARAEPLYQRSLNIREAKLGRNHPQVALALHDLAWNSARQKEWSRAIDQVQRARHGTASHLSEILPVLSEKEKLSLLHATFKRPFHRALSLGWAARDEAGAASAEWLLNGKAVAHQSLAEQHLFARDTKDPKAKLLAENLQHTRARLGSLVNRLPAPGKELEYQQEMQELKTREQNLSQKLARAVGRPYRAHPWVSLNELRGRLGPRTVFVDIARFTVFDFTTNRSKGPRYVAWITRPNGKESVQVIDLGDAKPIDQLVEQARKSLTHSAKSVTKVGEIEALEALQEPLQALSAKVLHPLLPALEKYEEWIVSPDGALWLTPWNALLLPDGKFAVEKHLIRHVVSGRDLVLHLPKSESKSAYIFADPDYDLSPAKILASAQGVRGIPSGSLRMESPHREGDDLRFAGVARTLPKVSRLPGTAAEAKAVSPQIQQWLGQKPNVFLEGRATKATLKTVTNPRVLSLATHGYFLPAQKVQTKQRPGLELGENSRAVALFDVKGQPIENPLLRCGLLLAGCNKRSEAWWNEDDGILTGLEIVGMNLTGCELVVLSACDTGLGDVHSGEGVAGLRQAFQLAGAKGVLASLWQVPDHDTALLMNAFYGKLAKGHGQADALRQAQLERIAARRSTFGAAHPFFWSAFALTTRGAD
jgi:CHAT domain-containing protein/Tfp pilus assembly protein PilF